MPNLLPKFALFSISAAKLQIKVVLLPQILNKVLEMLTNCLKRYPLSLLTTVIIVFLSLAPIGQVEIVEDVPFADKWTHMVMYGGFVVIIWWEYWRQHRRADWGRCLMGAFVAPIVMSGILELMQAYCTNYRSGEWLDLAANAVGVCVGTLIGIAILPHFIAKK